MALTLFSYRSELLTKVDCSFVSMAPIDPEQLASIQLISTCIGWLAINLADERAQCLFASAHVIVSSSRVHPVTQMLVALIMTVRFGSILLKKSVFPNLSHIDG